MHFVEMKVRHYIWGGLADGDAVDITEDGEGDGEEDDPVTDAGRSLVDRNDFRGISGHRLMHHIMSRIGMQPPDCRTDVDRRSFYSRLSYSRFLPALLLGLSPGPWRTLFALQSR